jgi:hypothetical protein
MLYSPNHNRKVLYFPTKLSTVSEKAYGANCLNWCYKRVNTRQCSVEQANICYPQIRNLYFLIGILTIMLLSAFFAVANALLSEDEIMARIDREAERINEIMNQKIQNDPGLSDLDGYCYESVDALEQCEKEIANEMQSYYDEAGERIWEGLD